MRHAILYHLYNLKNVKKKQRRSITFSKVAGFSLKQHSSMCVFHFFKIKQMVPNRATHHIFLPKTSIIDV